MQTTAATVFPGLYCPGLIEADSRTLTSIPLYLCFRGSIAPASLKPVGGLGRRPDALRVSGALLPRPH